MERDCLSKQNISWMKIPGTSNSDLLENKSLTKSLSCEYSHDYSKSLDIIGETFNRNVYKYSTRYLKRKKMKTDVHWRPLNQDGKLIYPPIQCVREHEEKMKLKLEKKAKNLEFKPDNIITLQELAERKTLRKLPSKGKRKVKKESEDPRFFEEEVNR